MKKLRLIFIAVLFVFVSLALAACDLFGCKHEHTEEIIHQPTCTEEGDRTVNCLDCGANVVWEILPAAHTFEATIIPAACETAGYTHYVCSVCGAEKDEPEEHYEKPLGHAYTVERVVAPTCTEEGYTLNKCTRCGDSYRDQFTGMVPHSYSHTALAPTCMEQGGDLYTCSECGATKLENAIPAYGHNFGAGFVCGRCGDVIGGTEYTDSLFETAQVIRPASPAEVPTSVSGRAVVLDLSAIGSADLNKNIVVLAQNLRVKGNPEAEYLNLSLQIAREAGETVFLELADLKVHNNSAHNSTQVFPVVYCFKEPSIFLCFTGSVELISEYVSPIWTESCVLNIVGTGSASVASYYYGGHDGIYTNQLNIYLHEEASLSVEGGRGNHGASGTSYDRSNYAKENCHSGGNGDHGSSGGNGVLAEKIVIYMAGEIAITGGPGGNGGNGGNGEGSNLPGEGRAGRGGMGGYGGYGGSALYCNGLEIVPTDSETALLRLTGGDGGNGGNGGGGGHPYAGNERDNAGHGGDGGRGGNSGYAICLETDTSVDVSALSAAVVLKGGKGGNGGHGGNGGNGAPTVLWDTSYNGSGGDGGDGGNSPFTYHVANYNSATLTYGEGGKFGYGGSKGVGGTDDPSPVVGGRDDRGSVNGQKGENGIVGNRGDE